jgi:hypothetical protein
MFIKVTYMTKSLLTLTTSKWFDFEMNSVFMSGQISRTGEALLSTKVTFEDIFKFSVLEFTRFTTHGGISHLYL